MDVDGPDGGVDDGSSPTVGARSLLGLLTLLPERRDGDAIAVVNGLFGDALDERDSPLATPMTVRAGAVVLPLGQRHATRRAGGGDSRCQSTDLSARAWLDVD